MKNKEKINNLEKKAKKNKKIIAIILAVVMITIVFAISIMASIIPLEM